MESQSGITLEEYAEKIKETDKLKGDIETIALGLFGEVGSILSSAKKERREGGVYDFKNSIQEEIGDALWYFCRLSRSLGFDIEQLMPEAYSQSPPFKLIATNHNSSPVAHLPSVKQKNISETLPCLGKAAADLLHIPVDKGEQKSLLKSFFSSYLDTVSASGVKFHDVVDGNLKKTQGRFLRCSNNELPNFDEQYEEDERLPDTFEIEIKQKKNGKTYMKWQGVFIGDPLTDNIKEEDYYRFHDVFHMANAAILHWSPTFRALIKHKRKSDPLVDEHQDSGRAIVIEEGLTAWVFSVAKEHALFEDQEQLSFGLLKNIQQFVKGYEVERCPASLWESAILEGYKVFRDVKKYSAGTVIGNRKDRTIRFVPHENSSDA
ncbi:nucleoside triphosphate pyrophosphohydrolase family protein [Halomonas sp. I1]|uniref:nucleoside triphosphate pyrophosphohydrolase family protein n=1 Tax=Halomonas sp. I1 TaxID=393536 RepID=UPI0028DD9B80|nr:nucleoside triphosphate pyrophosphohydrolase family protein [Halomonas sp. I1]MDT8896057.1 nucleoside triphosphate pyrophosphohydrolase family protein [Halomonas sp. I1]